MNFKNFSFALLLLLLSVNFIFSQGSSIIGTKEKGIESNYYFHSPDGVKKFNISATKIALKFDGKISKESLDKLINENPELKNFDDKSLHKLAGYTILNINSKISKSSDLEKITTKLRNLYEVISAQPLLIYEDGTEQIATEKIMVKLFNKSDLSQLQNDAIKFDFTISDSYAYDDKVCFINVNPTSTLSTIVIANTLAESKKYSTAEPIFVKLLERMNTNDPFLSYQWSLNNTASSLQYNGTPGADMNVLNAWGISTGSNTIKVAIIDEGVDLNHPDLVANLLPGFDATGQGSGGGPQGNDAHGTACAGIVAASANNNIGIAGIAYNTKIVPVRIAYSSGSNWVTNDTWISTAIDWAWNQGQADVLSNSWGGGSPSTLINDAISRAVTQGRANKGAAVLFAAGNNNSAVTYPATNANTISVIAMSMCNQRKSPSSCDNETWWGSNYGVNADIAAPGVKIYTTDISGAAGYESGDYESTFNGTSSACPNAAGVMALILSVNPNLTYAQARQILESTCEKTGGYYYNGNVSGQPNGTWSIDLGYGRVNAFAALQLASGLACSGTPVSTATLASHTNLCVPTNVTLTLQTSYPLSGTTFQWQESADGNNYTNVSGATNNFYVSNITSSKWFRCVITCTSTVNSTPVIVNYLDQTIYTYPHTQNFNASTLPCGWSIQNVNNDNFTWAARTTGPRTPSYGMSYLKNTTLAANDWFFSPPLNMNAGTNYAVRFWYKGSSVTLTEKLEVKWGSTNTDAGMISSAIYSNTNINTTTYQAINSAVISPSSSGSYYVGFRVFSNANMGNLMIDDITFDIVSPCSIPIQGGTITGPSTIEAGNATISTWTIAGNTGSDLQWQISANNGTSWSDLSGFVTSNMNYYIPVTGNYLLRVKVGSLNCPDAFSNTFTLTVIPRVGDVISNPILISSPYGIYMNIGAQSGFANNYTGPNAQVSNDVYFKLTTGACIDTLAIGTCGSGFDTYIHVLDANGTHLFSVDDTPLCGQQAVVFFQTLPNTTYYIVAEGWNTSTGALGFGTEEFDNPIFNAVITPDGSIPICEGENLNLTASTGASYLWSNGTTTQTTTINSAGLYSITITDANGCTAMADIAITSTPPTTLWYQDVDGDGYGQIELLLLACTQPVGYVSDNSDCNDNDALIHEQNIFYGDMDEDGYGGSVVGAFCLLSPPQYWSANDDDCNDNNANINPGETELCGNSIDDNCNVFIDESCCAININGVVTNAMCSNVPNGNINITVTNGVAPFTFLWSNNATTEDINNLSIGNYSITVTDNSGCSATSMFSVSHNNQAPAAATAINGPAGACRNQTNVIFSVIPITGASSYIWTLPNGANGSSTTNTISVNFGNNFNTSNICVRAVNTCGQSANYCRQVLRYTSAPAVPGTITGLSKGVCPNTTYSYSISPVNNATSYIWTAPNNASIVNGQGTINVTVSFGANFGTSGTLSVRSSNCIGNSNNRNLTIQRNPAQPSTITGLSPVCKNQQGIVYSVTNVPEYTYNWVVPNGCTIVSGQGTNSVTVNWGTNSGSIAVQSIVSCAASPFRSRNITANTCGNAPETINNEMALTSLFEVYPNPNNGNTKIYLNAEKVSNYQLDVLNMQGQLVKRLIGNTVRGDNYFDVDITTTISGIYYIKYSDTNGLLHTRTVIKE